MTLYDQIRKNSHSVLEYSGFEARELPDRLFHQGRLAQDAVNLPLRAALAAGFIRHSWTPQAIRRSRSAADTAFWP